MDLIFIAHMMNGLLMIAIPVGLAIFLVRKFRLDWRLWWIGAATFVLSQVGHIPFNWAAGQLLNRTSLADWAPTARLVFNAIFLGLSAGLFEELFRYGMYRWWAKDARSWQTGLLVGAGHGGAEAIILGILVLVAFFQFVAYRNLDLSTVFPPDQIGLAQYQVTVYWSASWYASLMGAVERFFTLAVQVSLALIVLQTFIRKQWFWVWLAVLYHALSDAVGAVIVPHYFGVYWSEATIGMFALASWAIIFLLRRSEPQPAPVPATVPGVPDFTPKPVEESPENLGDTRYQ